MNIKAQRKPYRVSTQPLLFFELRYRVDEMSQQKALLITEKQGDFKIVLTDKPIPGHGEVLVKVTCNLKTIKNEHYQ